LPYARGASSSGDRGGVGEVDGAPPSVGGTEGGVGAFEVLGGVEVFGGAGFSANCRYEELKERHWQRKHAAASNFELADRNGLRDRIMLLYCYTGILKRVGIEAIQKSSAPVL
jgi:hypothetical protein